METIIDKFKKLSDVKEKISVVTCYDASFAKLISGTAVDAILIGDSLGMVIQGHESTLPVTLDEMIYHAKAVRRGNKETPIICDLPFLSYHTSLAHGIESAGKICRSRFVGSTSVAQERSSESHCPFFAFLYRFINS